MVKALLTFLLLLLPPVAHAQIAGQQDPAYLAARDAWLAGEDATALQQLSTLAGAGNTAAQVLLGQIEHRPHLHSHITGDMDRKTRIALLRQPGGLSGKSWLKAAAANAPLAAAFLDARKLDTQAAAALVLLENGEAFAALQPAMNLIRHGKSDAVLPLLDHPLIPQNYAASLRYWHSGLDGTPDLPRPATSEWLLWSQLSPAKLTQEPLTLISATVALSSMPEAAPVRDYCAAHCAETANTCAVAVWTQTTSINPFALRTPTQSLIPHEDYVTSARFETDLVRLAQSSPIPADITSQLNACAAVALDLK